jgi:hypothetical protein
MNLERRTATRSKNSGCRFERRLLNVLGVIVLACYDYQFLQPAAHEELALEPGQNGTEEEAG